MVSRKRLCHVRGGDKKGSELAAQGAHIIDIGAESTLPNAEIVAGTEQADRLLPF